jgi:hypothetical protein
LNEVTLKIDTSLKHLLTVEEPPPSRNRKCKTLVAYSSVTTVGDESSYEAEEGETIWGARMIRRNQ